MKPSVYASCCQMGKFSQLGRGELMSAPDPKRTIRLSQMLPALQLKIAPQIGDVVALIMLSIHMRP